MSLIKYESFEEPAECLDCGQWVEAENLNRYSLNAFAIADDYDLFCPNCDSDNIKLHKPLEDRLVARLKVFPSEY